MAAGSYGLSEIFLDKLYRLENLYTVDSAMGVGLASLLPIPLQGFHLVTWILA